MRFGAAAIPVVVLLSLLAFVASVAVAERARMDGRAERLLAAFAIWLGIVELPTYGLAWANLLYPGLLAAVSVAVSAGVLALSGVGRRPGEHVRIVLSDLLSTLRLPGDAIVETARQRTFVLVGVLACAAMIVWTAWLSYLASPAGWDGLFYHDTIVAFAIQNHGFRLVQVPPEVWPVNNFPRTVETLYLWFVGFGDRRLLEIGNSVMAVPLLAGVYVMARRYTPDRVFAMGCACAILLMPGTFLLLRSTYIDLTVAAYFVSALHFATRPVLRLRDVWLSALMLGLLLGAKSMAIAWVPLVAVVLLVRVIAAHGRSRALATVATVLGGSVLLVAIGAPNYLRNWSIHGSPIWPWGFESRLLHIHWPGSPRQLVDAGPGKEASSLFGTMLSPPVPGRDWPDAKEHGYGLGIPLLVVPLGLIGLAVAVAKLILAPTSRTREALTVRNLLYTAVPVLMTIPTAPDLIMARYNLHVPVVLLLLCAWLLHHPRWARIREGVSATIIVTSLLLWYWAAPGWAISWSTAWDLAHMTARERAGARVQEFLPETKVAEAREKELHAGDVVAFGNGILFPAQLWNEHYTNTAVWIPSTLGAEAMLERADEIGAKWYVVSSYSTEYHALQRAAAWQEVGQLSVTTPAMVAYRRIGR